MTAIAASSARRPQTAATTLPQRLTVLAEQPWFAYGTLLLLQLHRMWGGWEYRELSGGDTCSYFSCAYTWFRHNRGDFAWSPLYTWFYGLMLRVTSDAAMATILHRVLIACAATLLVLAVLRRMLPGALAWLVAAWWAMLPINFDTMYEVHLFAVLPVLLAWWVILAGKGPWARGTAIAILLLSALLVRNEMLLAAIFLTVVCLGWELWGRRRVADFGRSEADDRSRTARVANGALAYLVPIGVAIAIVIWFLAHSSIKGKHLYEEIVAKHVTNMGQVYAFGYSQRHPEWNGNPWLDFESLCQRDFGSPTPTLTQMLKANPAAYARHVLWNYSLVPNGVQMLLFNAASGRRDPDYAGGHLHRRYPLFLSIAALAILMAGAIQFWRQRPYWWGRLVQPRLLGWLAMLSVIAVDVLLVIPTQRPRPAYLFPLSLVLMCCIATALLVITAQSSFAGSLSPLMPALMVGLALGLPSFYRTGKVHPPRPLLEEYERLKPYGRLLSRPRARFIGSQPVEMRVFLGYNRPPESNFSGYTIFRQIKPGESLVDFLDSRGVNVLEMTGSAWYYLEDDHPGLFQQFLESGAAAGWRLLALDEDGAPWLLFARSFEQSTSQTSADLSDLRELSGRYAGWRPLGGWGRVEGPYPRMDPPLPVVRWGLAPASHLELTDSAGGRFTFGLTGMTPLTDQELTIRLDARQVARFPMRRGIFMDFTIPLQLSPGRHRIDLCYSRGDQVSPHVSRAVLFKRLEALPTGPGKPNPAAQNTPQSIRPGAG